MLKEICIGSDHRGYALKQYLQEKLPNFKWRDVGAPNAERSDYPVFAEAVCRQVQDGNVDLGILICGSGTGMSIAANRHKGIYAGLCWSEASAKVAKEDDGTNVLVIPSDFISHEIALTMVVTWLNAQFKGGRYQERLNMLD
jgi:ribose 5-phosphate isomerase B